MSVASVVLPQPPVESRTKSRRRPKREANDYEDTWEGGFVRRDAKGRKVFIIRRMVAGKVFKISTRAHTESAALAQLKRFEANPAAFRAGGDDGSAPLRLDDDLEIAFLAFCRDERHNSADWVTRQKRFLGWWRERLKGRDLRRVSLTEDINPALEGTTNRAHKIAVLKALYGWLRKKRHLVKPAEDPTFQTLTVPQVEPEQWTRVKAIPREHYLAAREHLAQHWRDGMDVQAGTGWHVTELMRFAKGGSVELYPGNDASVAGVLVCPWSKGGEPLRTAVSADVLQAGKRVLKRGTLGREKYGKAIHEACAKAEVPAFTPGCFRHSVATWAVNAGTDPAKVAAFLNHRSAATTRRFYATHAVPAKVPTLR